MNKYTIIDITIRRRELRLHTQFLLQKIMITHLVKKPGGYICHNCRMKQQEIKETCWFCGYFFSNYEIVLLKNYKEQNDEIFE